VEKWNPRQAAEDLPIGRHNGSLNDFFDTLTNDQLKDLVRGLEEMKFENL